MSHSEKQITCRVEGEGPPLLLLNGIGMTIASWQPVMNLIRKKFKIIRCDFRGQLMSPLSVPSDITEHADDLNTLLDTMNVDSVHVMGTSFGALVAVLLASRYPEKVRSMTLVAAADKFDRAMSTEVNRWIKGAEDALENNDKSSFADVINPVVYSERYLEENMEQIQVRKGLFRKFPDQWFLDLVTLMKSTEGVDLFPLMKKISCPVQAVAAELDGFIPIERTEGLALNIPGAEFKIIKNAGHAVVIENPEAIAELIDEFIVN